MRRPLMLWPLIVLLITLALGGFYGGIAMLTDPSGSSLGVGEVLPLLPVKDFILPGFFLLTVMGVVPLLIAYCLIARPDWTWASRMSEWSSHYWAWTSTIALVAVLAAWLIYEVLLIGLFPITYMTAIVGLLIVLCALIPSVRRDFANSGG